MRSTAFFAFAFLVPLLLTSSPAEAQAIRVAVEKSASSLSRAQETADQLNDDTYFDFEAVVVDATQLDTQAELDEYDVLIIGSSGDGDPVDWTDAIAAEWSAWSSDGRGGVVSTAWMAYSLQSPSSALAAATDPIVPFDSTPSAYTYCSSATLSIDVVHPVTEGVASHGPLQSLEGLGTALDTGATTLGQSSCGGPSVVVGSNGSGRLVYLGTPYLGSASYVDAAARSGDPDRLLEQAVAWAADSDGDGAWNSVDCDPADPLVGAPDTLYADLDGDGYGAGTSIGEACSVGPDQSTSDADCDDDDGAVNPGADEVCDLGNVDEDCDGAADDADPQGAASGQVSMYADADGDGYGAGVSIGAYCDVSANVASTAGDCDDDDGAVNPGADEVCDLGNVDEDCDGAADDADPEGAASGQVAMYADADGDGYGGGSSIGAFCDPGPSQSTSDADCDDDDGAVHPGAVELAGDLVDEDCSGTLLCYLDADSDGARHPTSTSASTDLDCTDPTEALAGDPIDCNDLNSSRHPGAPELANGADDDCDDAVDEDTPAFDDDGDGYAEDAGDCDDGDAAVAPGATEVCDMVDQDCDGRVDEGTSCVDDDDDGYTEDAGDCDDADADAHPGASEVADNGADDDCDGDVDEGGGCAVGHGAGAGAGSVAPWLALLAVLATRRRLRGTRASPPARRASP